MATPYPITARYMDYNLTAEDVTSDTAILLNAPDMDYNLNAPSSDYNLGAPNMDYNLTAEE